MEFNPGVPKLKCGDRDFNGIIVCKDCSEGLKKILSQFEKDLKTYHRAEIKKIYIEKRLDTDTIGITKNGVNMYGPSVFDKNCYDKMFED
jgi:hypothetical protein